jgi:hypothetical protein
MANVVESADTLRRPGVVTAASWLLYVAAAGQVLSAVITLSQLGATKQAYQKVFAGTSMKGAESMLVAINAATAVGIGLLLAIGYVVLGILDGRGKNPARIVTWVVAGVSICCFGVGQVINAVGFTGMGANSGSGAPSAEEIRNALSNALPSWYQPTLATIGILSIIALLATVILLALPAANAFFRRPKVPEWEPPVPPVPPPTA